MSAVFAVGCVFLVTWVIWTLLETIFGDGE